MTKPKFYRMVIVRSGQLRAPLLGEYRAPWDKVGPDIKQIIDKTCGDIDKDATYEAPRAYCLCCRQRIAKHDRNTAFPMDLGYDEDDRWLDVTGGACCEQCSQLADYELRKLLTE